MPPRKQKYELPEGRLWPNTPHGQPMTIPVIGASGEFGTGKTLLGQHIAPGVHSDGHPFAGQPRTRLYDFELSSVTYSGYDTERVFVPDKMQELFTDPNTGTIKPYSSIDVFKWWISDIQTIKPGQFDVIMADTASHIEDAIEAYIRQNPTQFGLTAKVLESMESLFWVAMRKFWEEQLLKVTVKCKCFYFTTHATYVWKEKKQTAKRKPRGKDILKQLATLYLWMERPLDAKGKKPEKPSAVPLKHRIADTWIDQDGLPQAEDLLPARLPVCTVEAIRKYIANPANLTQPRQGETVIEKEMTADERLQLELAKAEAERDTEGSRLTRLQRTAELQAMMNQGGKTVTSGTETQPVAKPEESARPEVEEQSEVEAPTYTEPVNPPGDKATRSQVNEINKLCGELGVDEAKLLTILAKVGAVTVKDLSRQYAHLLIERLNKKATEQAKDEIGKTLVGQGGN